MEETIGPDEIDIDSLPDYTTTKRRIVIALILAAAVEPPVRLLASSGSEMIGSMILGMLMVILGMTWVYYDSLELGDPIGIGMRIAVLFVGGLAIPVYLFRSRGFKYGMIACGRMLLLGIIMVVINVGEELMFMSLG